MIQSTCVVRQLRQVAHNTFVLSFDAPAICTHIRPGQFLNIRVEESCEPLLRRPYSVYRVDGTSVEVIFNVVGKGSVLLQRKRSGDMLDVLGPLGVPFSLEGEDYDTAVLVGGGLGVAPLPIATSRLAQLHRSVLTFLGFRSKSAVVLEHLVNVHVATDDGSVGLKGTVVDLLEQEYASFRQSRPKLFACGPTPMLKAVAKFAAAKNIPCEVSLEGPMACGVGICQGCPVELREGDRRYALMCKDGPTFDIRRILLS